MNPLTELSLAWRGTAMVVAGQRDAAGCFSRTPMGLAISLGWFVLALLLSAAAQAAALGMPRTEQVALGLAVQGGAVAALALAMTQSLRFLKLDVPVLALLVPTVYFVALVQVLAIPLALLGPNAQLIAVFVLALLIWRMAAVIGHMRSGTAIAFALLGVLVLVVVPNALYIVFLHVPSPA